MLKDAQAKKELVIIFNNVLRRQVGNTMVTVQWLEKNPTVLLSFVRGYDVPDIALNCGAMLRECLRYENLTKLVLNSADFYSFFKFVEVSNFDLASDAFKSLRVRRTCARVCLTPELGATQQAQDAVRRVLRSKL